MISWIYDVTRDYMVIIYCYMQAVNHVYYFIYFFVFFSLVNFCRQGTASKGI